MENYQELSTMKEKIRNENKQIPILIIVNI